MTAHPLTAARTVKEPSPEHPITIEPAAGRVVVRAGGQVVADSRAALTLREANYPPVHYVPRTDVAMRLLHRTDHATYCPYKGECGYFDVDGAGAANAVWSYEAPFPAVGAIKDHLAFYPDRVDSIVIEPG